MICKPTILLQGLENSILCSSRSLHFAPAPHIPDSIRGFHGNRSSSWTCPREDENPMGGTWQKTSKAPPPHPAQVNHARFHTRQNASSSVSQRKSNTGFSRHRGRENNPKYLLRPVSHPRIQSEISTEPLPGVRHFP